jgi:hypothetical protein
VNNLQQLKRIAASGMLGLLALLMLTAPAHAAMDVPPEHLIDGGEAERARDLADKLRYASDNHIHIWKWLLVLTAVTIVGLLLHSLFTTLSTVGAHGPPRPA